MKKYLLVISFMFMIISSYGLYKYLDISAQKDNILHFKTKLGAFQLLNQEQNYILKNLSSVTNYDDITKKTQIFNDTFKELKILSQEVDSEQIKIYMQNMEKDMADKNVLVEDFKSDHAAIKNSIALSMNIYHSRMHQDPKTLFISVELLDDIYNMLLGYYTKSRYHYKSEHIPFSTKMIDDYRKKLALLDYFPQESKTFEIMLYANILNVQNYYNDLVDLNSELEEKSILKDIKTVDMHLDELEVNYSRIESIMLFFMLISALIFLAVAIWAYYQLREGMIKNTNLALELQQFVDALNASAIVSKTDTTGKITFVNDTFCKISGYSKDELIGKSQNIVRHPDMKKEVFRKLWKTIKSKKIFKAVIKNRKKDGSSYYIDSTIIPLFNSDGDIVEYLAVRHEVSELVKAHKEAMQAEKVKSEFLSNMSHELRTPLNAIIGFSQILIKREEKESSRNYLESVLSSSEHLLQLINDILDSAKIQSGKFKIDRHNFLLLKELHRSVANFETIALSADVKIIERFDDNLDIEVYGDWIRILQIINNFLSNAIKFSHPGSEVIMGVRFIDEMLYIKIKDFGVGMSEDVQSRIFKSFVQADNTTSRTYGGTGLGLSIVADLVKLMDGGIKVESKDGEGSAFTVNIPLKICKQHKEKDI